MIKKFHLKENPIPEGFQIYEDRLDVMGISYRKSNAQKFVKSNDLWLELEREPYNKHDKNAIKVMGCSKGFLWTNRRFIGYVPGEVANDIVQGGFWDHVKPRLLKTYLGDDGFVEVMFQILGPKGQKNQYEGK